MFAFGDCSTWLIASKESVIGENYSNEDRCILESSESSTPYFARWYYRSGNSEDPWVSTIDHSSASSAGKMVYGEASKNHHLSGENSHAGANVWIRQNDQDIRSCNSYVLCKL